MGVLQAVPLGSAKAEGKKTFAAPMMNGLDNDILQSLLRAADGEDNDGDVLDEEDEEDEDSGGHPMSMLAAFGGYDDGPSFLLQRHTQRSVMPDLHEAEATPTNAAQRPAAPQVEDEFDIL